MRKKLLAIIAAVAMMVAMVPSMVFADGEIVEVSTADELVAALEQGKDVVFKNDIKIDPANMSNGYGKTGINVTKGQTIDGAGFTLDIKGASGTWDSGINTTGGLIKNLKVTGSFRGIFVNHNSTHSERVVLENVTVDGPVYTISCDQGLNQGLTARNSTFNGWTSFAATIGDVVFENCTFGEGSGYAFCRPFAETKFIKCDFEKDYVMDPRDGIELINCTLDGEQITEKNMGTLVTNANNASASNYDCIYKDAAGETKYRENHEFGTELKKDADNHWNECDCGEKANIKAHKYDNGVCVCGAEDPKTDEPAKDTPDDVTGNESGETAEDTDVEESEDAVDTGDNMNTAIPFAIGGLALAAMAAVVATRRRTN